MSTDPSGGTQTDAELASRLVRGDDRALAEVYQRHAPRVLAVANAVLGDQSAAEDVCHDVFIDLSRQPLGFDSARGSLGTYLVAGAHDRALDRLRFDQAVASSLATQIWAAVSALPADEAEALRLAYFGDTTYPELARILEVPEGTVRGRIRSGLRRLRAAFVEQGIIAAT